MARHEAAPHIKSEPEMAIEVLDEKIGDGKLLEQALVVEHLFRKTIEKSIPVGIAAFDTQWHQIYVNHMFCNMVGWQEMELLDMSFPQPYWFFKEIRSMQDIAIKTVCYHMLSTEKTEIQFRRKDDTHFWGLVFTQAIVDSTGRITGHMISVTDISEQKKTENALKMVSAKLIDAQEKERKHVAQDLHDSIGGKLTGIKYSLERMMSDMDSSQEDLITGLKGTIAAVRSAIEETQRITKNLHPSMIEDLGIIPALRGHCREFMTFYPFIKVRMEFDLEEKEVPNSLKIIIYRVVQEGLNNVVKHSRADKVRVILKCIEETISLILEDDGIGFDAQKIIESSETVTKFGIESMRERTELFGGRFLLQSCPGQGTRIQGVWPVSGS